MGCVGAKEAAQNVAIKLMIIVYLYAIIQSAVFNSIVFLINLFISAVCRSYLVACCAIYSWMTISVSILRFAEQKISMLRTIIVEWIVSRNETKTFEMEAK